MMMIIIITYTIVIIINDIWVALDRSATMVIVVTNQMSSVMSSECLCTNVPSTKRGRPTIPHL